MFNPSSSKRSLFQTYNKLSTSITLPFGSTPPHLTVSPDGSEKIMGTAADLTVSIERAGLTLVYTDGTQGWLLKDK